MTDFVVQRKLDRLPEFDERSRLFRAVAGIETRPFRSYTWRCVSFLDQGTEGACVGYSWSHELAARPVEITVNEDMARSLYHRARQLDQWEGEDYEGTSVLAGAKAVQEMVNRRGLSVMSEYRWAFGIEDVVRTIGYKGPVVFGIDWYNDMYEPSADGFVTPTGELAGGHAILGRGIKIFWTSRENTKDFNLVDLDRSYVLLRNSWGLAWGKAGDAKISLRDLKTLLDAQGEACVPVQRKR